MNSLSLDAADPRWSETLSQWADGQEYDVTLRVRQTAPGEFDVTSLEESAMPVEEAPMEEPEPEMPARDMGGKMPAVAVVIAKGRGK